MDWEIELSIVERLLTNIFEMAAIMTKKRKGKSKRVKVNSPDQKDNTVDVPSADKPESDENLIYSFDSQIYVDVRCNPQFSGLSEAIHLKGEMFRELR